MLRSLTVCPVLLALLCAGPGHGEDKKSPFDRWNKSIEDIEKRLKDKAPSPDAVFFAGSSSIVRWDLAKSFPKLPGVNVGFGGSQIADSTHFAPRILFPHAPKTIVFYAGDNDIASGKSPETVAENFKAFVAAIHGKLPRSKIFFLSIKPSIARWKLIDKVRKANALIEAECRKDERLKFVDVGTPMLGNDGKPKAELFVKDGLHLSPEGYRVWVKVVKPLLDAKP